MVNNSKPTNMIDINIYRARIGQFDLRKNKNICSFRRNSIESRRLVSQSFNSMLIIILLVALVNEGQSFARYHHGEKVQAISMLDSVLLNPSLLEQIVALPNQVQGFK